MTSQIQLEANRKNATLSTGPRTHHGKSRSRLNATRHGLTGQISAMSDADRAAHDEFTTKFIHDLLPKTTLELHLATAIAQDTWRLNRIRAIEDNIFALGLSDPDCAVEASNREAETALTQARVFEKQAHTLQLLSLYERRINSTLHKNLKTLRELQTERRRNEAPALHPRTAAASAPATTKRPDGFVFSDHPAPASMTLRQQWEHKRGAA